MIDIHTHVLPGCDDGAVSLDETLEMACVAVADGIRELVATPHLHICRLDRFGLSRHLQVVQTELDAQGIPLRLLLGAEVWLTARTAEDYAAGAVFTINAGPYMLVELPLYEVPAYTLGSIAALQQAGVKPVLAHPERYVALDDDPGPLYNMVDRGVVVQITAGGLLGAFGREAKERTEKLLEHKLAHVIASDAHSARDRLPELSEAVDRAAQLIGEAAAHEMVTATPLRIIAGEDLTVPEPLPWRKKSWLSRSRSR